MIKNQTLSSANSQRGLTHLPELDSLRAFAIILVLLAHYLPEMHVTVPFLWYGVDVFFAISGFLITAILLYALDKNDGARRLHIIKNFMIRRILRLFPLYYLFITLFWLLKHFAHLQLWKDDFTSWFFTYTPNLLFFQKGLAHGAYFSHLWSLGVEEQFYLFWPWIALFICGVFRKVIILTLILVALLCLFFLREEIRLLPFANFHTLGIGALIACYYKDNGTVISWLKTNRMLLVILSTAHLLAVLFLLKNSSGAAIAYRAFSVCICAGALVIASIFGWQGFMKKITRHSFVQYIGKISYGIYIFHFVVPPLFVIFLKKANITLAPLTQFFLYFPVIFAIAALSYRYLEMPFLKLKPVFKD